MRPGFLGLLCHSGTMEHDKIDCLPDWPLLQPLPENSKKAVASLIKGDIREIAISSKMPVDCVVNHALDTGIVGDVLGSFPDSRKSHSVPVEAMLLAKVMQSLSNHNSLISAPYMLNDASVMAKLGYNYEVLEKGFNDRNRHDREAPCHGDTLRQLLLGTPVGDMLRWFNRQAGDCFVRNTRGKTGIFVVDGVKLHVPSLLVDKFQNAGVVKDNEGQFEYGYKVVWIYELIGRKGVIRGLEIAPINVHDLVLGKKLVKGFPFGEGSLLLMDRGFWDGEWISSLKEDRGIDICIPLKKNLFLSELAVNNDVPEELWKPNPKRKGQEIREMLPEELEWEDCPVFKSGAVVRFVNKKTGKMECVVFVDTREDLPPEKILETYDLRWEIEEAHRQMKLFQGLEDFKSKKYGFVVFHILMGAVAYNMFNLFLNSEGCENLKDFTLKLANQKRRNKYEKNPEIIIYTKDCFAIMKTMDFLQLILGLPKDIQGKLQDVFARQSYDTS